MATLKETLEQKLVDPLYIGNNLFQEASIDDKEDKYFKISTKIIESGEYYDVHECIITLKSNKELSDLINKMNLIRILRRIQEPLGFLNETPYEHILKVIDLESVSSDDKKTMDLTFHVINNIEKNLIFNQ